MYDNYLVLEQIPAHLRVDLDLNVSIMENLAWLDMIFVLLKFPFKISYSNSIVNVTTRDPEFFLKLFVNKWCQ